jgi:hypothetical protein
MAEKSIRIEASPGEVRKDMLDVSKLDRSMTIIAALASIGNFAAFLVFAVLQTQYADLWVPTYDKAIYTDAAYSMYTDIIVYHSMWINRGWAIAMAALLQSLSYLIIFLHCYAHQEQRSNPIAQFFYSLLHYSTMALDGGRPFMYFSLAFCLPVIGLALYPTLGYAFIPNLVFISFNTFGIVMLLIVVDAYTHLKIDNTNMARYVLVASFITALLILVTGVLMAPMIPIFVNLPYYASSLNAKTWAAFMLYTVVLFFLTSPIWLRRASELMDEKHRQGVLKPLNFTIFIECLFAFGLWAIIVCIGAVLFASRTTQNYSDALSTFFA